MIKALNIPLYPTQEQIILMYKHIGCMRFVHNWELARQIDSYKLNSKKLSVTDLGKQLTVLKNTAGYEWLYEVSNATLKDSIGDLDKAYTNFFNGSGFPKFKSKKKSESTFYSRYDKIYFKDNFVNLEKIGKVKYRMDYDIDLTTVTKFKNPRIHFNRRVWVLSVGIEDNIKTVKLNDFSLGIDLGISQLATRNVNKTNKVKKLSKKLKRLQRQCSRKYIMNKKGESYQKTKNIAKLEKKIKKLHSKCGFTCDRDKNASYNLANYGLV